MAIFTDEGLQIMADEFFKNNPDRSWIKLQGKYFDNNGELPSPAYASADNTIARRQRGTTRPSCAATRY